MYRGVQFTSRIEKRTSNTCAPNGLAPIADGLWAIYGLYGPVGCT